MEFLIGIGTGIVGKIAEYTVEPVGRQVGYLFHYKSNFQNLQNQVRYLGAAREDMQNKISEEERKGRKVGAYVNNWLADVEKIIGEANRIFEAEAQGKMKCLHGFCPSLKRRYQLNSKSTKLVRVVVELHEKKDITNFACDVPPQEVWTVSTKDYEAFDSRALIVKRIMDELRNPTIDMIGLYGIGGVGKTTLVKEVYRQARKDTKLFDDVVMVLDVKNSSNLEIVKKEIAQQLGLEVPKDESIPLRARLCERVKDKRILIIIDDVWEKIDLESLGLPHLPTCKILLTSRSRIVLSSDMGTQKEFQLQVLDKEETWRLFEKMSGDVVKHPAIREIATKVAKKCGGLPVLVVAVASALKNKSTPHAWRDALRRLKEFDKEEEMTKKAYMALEWSYDQLDGKELKPLFLLCGIWGKYLSLTNLLKYGMGLDLFKNVDTMEEARDALYSLVEKLKDSCLLLDIDDKMGVRMHDLVHDFAKQIAFRDQHVLLVKWDGELKEWPNEDFLKKCTKILIDGNIPMLPQVLESQELEMFIFCKTYFNESMEIPCSLFRETKKLKVLDLSGHRFPISLPSSFQYLKNLQMLCLDGCLLGDIALVGQLTNLQTLSFVNSKVKHLPKEIGQLTHLRLLDLSNCSALQVISPNVISSLTKLEDLSLRNSFNKWEAEVVNERSNASLSELKHLSQLTALQICIPDANTLPEMLFSDRLERYQILIGDVKDYMNDTTLNTLKLKLTSNNKLYKAGLKMLLKRCEDLYLDGTEDVNDIFNQLDGEDFQRLEHLHLRNNVNFTYLINTKVVFPNLATLSVHGDGVSRSLLSSSMARSLVQLKHLEISECGFMEEIVSTKDCGEENMDGMFPKLEGLRLIHLQNLTRFCTGSYIEFSSLEKLELVDCPKLGPFIIAPMSKNTTICKEIENRDSMENIDIGIPIKYSLFDEKVRFPRLEILVINGLSKLITIWHKQQLVPYSFCRLRRVEVSSCNNLINIFVPIIIGRLNALDADQFFNYQNLDSVVISHCSRLKNIFPTTVAKCLSQLQILDVSNCDEVEEIVAKEGGLEITPEFEFPKVIFVRFKYMSKLRSFYSGMHTSKWPLLKDLRIFRCDKVEIFATKPSIFQEKHEQNHVSLAKESFFLIEKDSFPNLEQLEIGSPIEIWSGPPDLEVAGSFGKLKYFELNVPFSKPAAIFLQNLQNLERLQVRCGSSKKIFVNDENEEIHAVVGITFPRVTCLELSGMDNLVHVGNGNSQAAGSVFPNLEILNVHYCHRLKIVESSAIPFKNLTTLKVNTCDGLEYLTTYSMAKSLMQLTSLEILSCGRMKGIVACNEEDVGNVISFSRLQHLTLEFLESLQGFCSENYLVEFPSLQTLSVFRCSKLKISPELERLRINRDRENSYYRHLYGG